MRALDQVSRKQYALTLQTYIGTTERKLGAAGQKGGSMLAKCRGFDGMDKEVSGTAARGICCGLGMQRYGPSYTPNQSGGAQGANQQSHTRFELAGRRPSITLKFSNDLTTLKVPHLRQTLDAVE